MIEPIYGTREHAESLTRGRHPRVQSALQWLTFSHIPTVLRPFAAPLYGAAVGLVKEIETDSAELTSSLNQLIRAKNDAVRAGIRHQHGRPGPVDRPQEVVDPPAFGQAQVSARPDQRIPGLPNHPDFRSRAQETFCGPPR